MKGGRMKNLLDKRRTRRLGRMIEKIAYDDAEKQNRLALETYALELKKKGVKQYNGSNFTLIIE